MLVQRGNRFSDETQKTRKIDELQSWRGEQTRKDKEKNIRGRTDKKNNDQNNVRESTKWRMERRKR
jgi:hypothetical protein